MATALLLIMISVIISSVHIDQLEQISENIAQTIGVPYEIIATDNGKGQKGICEVYNTAARKARYDILCLMHEDIVLKTQDWGLVVANCFADNPSLGLLGVAGSSYKTLMPSGWICYGLQRVLHYHILQSFKYSDKTTLHEYNNHYKEKLTRVACVDGVWFCTPKKVFDEFGFDEDLFKGFHCYDIDYSLSVSQKYEVGVTYDVLLEHLSEGKFEQEWFNETIKLHRKWKDYFPLNIAGLSRSKYHRVEWRTFKDFFHKMLKFNMKPFEFRDIFLPSKINHLGPKFMIKVWFYLLVKGR